MHISPVGFLTKRAFLGIIGAVACAGMAGCVFAPVVKGDREVRVAALPGKPISVVARNGSVSITQVDQAEVVILAKMRAQTAERLAAIVITAERTENGTLNIGATPPDQWKNNEGVSFEITLPDASGVTVKTGNGAVKVQGMGGDADLDTSNGSVSVTAQGGAVRARSSNGAMTVIKPRGEVVLHSSNGAIKVEDAPSSVHADTSNGSMTIRLTDESAGPIVADTSNGAITLSLGRGMTGVLRTSTSNGRVSFTGTGEVISAAKSRGEFRFSAEGAESVASSSNGAVTVERRN